MKKTLAILGLAGIVALSSCHKRISAPTVDQYRYAIGNEALYVRDCKANSQANLIYTASRDGYILELRDDAKDDLKVDGVGVLTQEGNKITDIVYNDPKPGVAHVQQLIGITEEGQALILDAYVEDSKLEGASQPSAQKAFDKYMKAVPGDRMNFCYEGK